MRDPKDLECWLCDKDGVLMHGDVPVPGAREFIQRLRDTGRRFLVLTNDSIQTPRDLSARMARAGLDVDEDHIWTSATATAAFLANQNGAKTAYVLGMAGLTTALHEAGFVPVSYTHLDVYKRQGPTSSCATRLATRSSRRRSRSGPRSRSA